jgi:hypothetical protein
VRSEKILLPEYNRGVRRVHNPAYQRVQREPAKASHRGDTATARSLRRKLRSLPTQDPGDPGYRRLRYVRYADDTLLGFTGPKAEAEEIKRRLSQFLQDELKLELNQEKTLITHARSQRARFLGYEVITQHTDRFLTNGRRSANGVIRLTVPKAVIKAKCARYMGHGKPALYRSIARVGSSLSHTLAGALDRHHARDAARVWPDGPRRRSSRDRGRSAAR